MKRLPLILSALACLFTSAAYAGSVQDLVLAQAIGGVAAPLRAQVGDDGSLEGILVFAPDPSIKPDFYSVGTFRKGADIGVADDKGKVHYGVFYIKAGDFDNQAGGLVTIRWTKNVLLQTHGSITLWAGRTDGGSGGWRLFNGGNVVNTLLVKVGTFGIDYISPN